MFAELGASEMASKKTIIVYINVKSIVFHIKIYFGFKI